MNIFAGLVKWVDLDFNELWIKVFIKQLPDELYYLFWYTDINSSKNVLEVIGNPSKYDLSISTEDKIKFVHDWEIVDCDMLLNLDFFENWYKSVSYQNYDFDEVLEKYKDKKTVIVREVEQSKFDTSRIIRVDILK